MEKMFPDEFKFSPKTWLLPYDWSELRNYVAKKKIVSMICKPECAS